jgi:hypothetical protein
MRLFVERAWRVERRGAALGAGARSAAADLRPATFEAARHLFFDGKHGFAFLFAFLRFYRGI